MAAFPPCIAFTIPAEGGFVNNPRDPGGATNHGITLQTLSNWRGHLCTIADMMALTVTEATNIYNSHYFRPMMCDALPAGVDLVVFDYGVNVGPETSLMALQRVVGQFPDGVNGPHTIAAVKAHDALMVIRMLSAVHEAHYRALPTFAEFGRGWVSRVAACMSTAIRMANGNLTTHVVLPQLPKPITPGYVEPDAADMLDDEYNQGAAS